MPVIQLMSGALLEAPRPMLYKVLFFTYYESTQILLLFKLLNRNTMKVNPRAI